MEDFSLSIAAGEKVGVVGRSGAGKPPWWTAAPFLWSGKGWNPDRWTEHIRSHRESLRAQIGVVTQDTSLLHRSIQTLPTLLHFWWKCDWGSKESKCPRFIRDLEDSFGRKGLRAHVGERESSFLEDNDSIIAIARIFLKDAPILVLDEASALDSEVEAAIQENLFELMKRWCDCPSTLDHCPTWPTGGDRHPSRDWNRNPWWIGRKFPDLCWSLESSVRRFWLQGIWEKTWGLNLNWDLQELVFLYHFWYNLFNASPD